MSRTVRNKIVAKKSLRLPKTFQERKWSFAEKEDGVSIRPKRKAKRLLSSYDEKIISASYEIPQPFGHGIYGREE